MTRTDRVRVTTQVPAAPAEAFRLFTEDVDQWWGRGPRNRFRPGRDGELRFEPGQPGRLVEIYDEAAGDVYEVGRILCWNPPEELSFEFRARSFDEAQRTVVEVRFEPCPAGTRITLEHRGWDSLASGHRARHGLDPDSFRDVIGVWWVDLLGALQTRARRGPASPSLGGQT